MKTLNILLILAVSVLILTGVVVFAARNIFPKPSADLKMIKINQTKIFVQVADTPLARSNGLSGQTGLNPNQGMLFLFESPGIYAFWMRGMLIPLDFVWINNHRITQITSNIKPQDFQPPKTLAPNAPVDAVLEINAGAAEKLNIKTGDNVEY